MLFRSRFRPTDRPRGTALYLAVGLAVGIHEPASLDLFLLPIIWMGRSLPRIGGPEGHEHAIIHRRVGHPDRTLLRVRLTEGRRGGWLLLCTRTARWLREERTIARSLAIRPSLTLYSNRAQDRWLVCRCWSWLIDRAPMAPMHEMTHSAPAREGLPIHSRDRQP